MGTGLISEQELRHELDTLNAEFRSSLPARIAQIEQQWARLRQQRPLRSRARKPPLAGQSGRLSQHAAQAQSDDVAQVARQLYQALHSLAGSAQVFGFAALGDAARRAERALGSRDHPRPPRAPDVIQQALKVMRKELR